MAAVSAPEFARPVRLDTLGDGPRAMTIEADAAERAALAIRFSVRAIDGLAAHVVLTRDGDIVRAEGMLSAAVVQVCAASGADVPRAIAEPFALRFLPEAEIGGGEEIELDAGEMDDIGYAGGTIDIGEAAAQTLALALDPFPRAPDADSALRAGGVVSEEEAGPFSALKGLRDLLKG